ncbi:SigE family RNA polymerase sigma factor [Nocardioides flavescens]|uniref:SigE family RNA polymerase sigma factor n=1 Tax=Nocardioides flavescens TaxID=2691959 RepID=A0A6L7EY01_9ACTN|nr:SigE family RNA polymerase sigma factor [Nocardioides flavescens]MXG88302.1 SigE family RNA polymerase sigma factor [Nocardioides flavescens]
MTNDVSAAAERRDTRTQEDFEEFVRGRSDALVATALLLCGSRQSAEDLVQTALARAWPRWHAVDVSHEAYVRRIMVNTYASWWRRRWNQERPTADLPQEAASAPDLDAHLDLRRAIARLPRRQRAVVVLRYFDDLSEVEIARTMGCSVGTVKSQAHRALRKLGEHLQEGQP